MGAPQVGTPGHGAFGAAPAAGRSGVPARPRASRLGYYPALTGLRGVAIATVVAFHLGLPVANGGLVGVSLFFTLSGFLITSLIVLELEAVGSLDVKAFYVRRVRRLVPALVVAIAVVLTVATIAGTGADFVTDSLLALSYFSNWARALGDPMGVWNHAWSLAIEEQFYLLWPLILLAAWRGTSGSRGWIAVGCLTLVVGVAWLRVGWAALGATGERLYFGSDTRADAILAGCAVGLLWTGRRIRPVPGWAAAAAGGALAFSAGAALDPATWQWPGALYSLVAVASAIVVLACVQERSFASRALSHRPLVWLGERSYSLYIWHVPVFMIIGAAAGQIEDLPRSLLALSVSALLAVISYEFVERRFSSARGLPSVAEAAVPAPVPVNASRGPAEQAPPR